jgi:hypothetical protein
MTCLGINELINLAFVQVTADQANVSGVKDVKIMVVKLRKHFIQVILL